MLQRDIPLVPHATRWVKPKKSYRQAPNIIRPICRYTTVAGSFNLISMKWYEKAVYKAPCTPAVGYCLTGSIAITTIINIKVYVQRPEPCGICGCAALAVFRQDIDLGCTAKIINA